MIDDPSAQRWYRQAVIYCVDVDTFQDSDGDGIGDLRGLSSRLRPPRPPRRHLPLAEPDPPDAAPRRRLRRLRLLRASTRGSARSATSSSWCTRPPTAASGSSSTSSSTTPPTSTPGSSRRERRPRLAVPRLVRVVQGRAGRPAPGHRLPGRAERDVDVATRRPSAWYYHRFYDFQPDLNWRNPEVARGDRARSWVLAAARRRGLPHRRRPVRHRARRARRRSPTRGLRDPRRLAAVPAVATGRRASCSARPT